MPPPRLKVPRIAQPPLVAPGAPRPGLAPAHPARPALPTRPARPVVPAPTVALPPAARAGALVNPEPPFSSEVPQHITDPRARAAHLAAVIHAHVVLREKTYYDSGRAILELMRLKDLYGAADIKELVTKAELPMAHMTAQKWMMIARVFDRATAVEHRAEKCYALIRYALVTGRAEDAAPKVLASDELLRGPVRVRARAATATQVQEAIEHLRRTADPARVADDAERQAVAIDTQKLARELGFAGARARVDDRGQIQITVSLEAAQGLRAILPKAIARWGKKALREDPEGSAPLITAGWKLRRTPVERG